MTEHTVALDFIDIALDEIEMNNFESAAEFIEDAAEIIEDDHDFENEHDELIEALEHLDEGSPEKAYDCARYAWTNLGNL